MMTLDFGAFWGNTSRTLDATNLAVRESVYAEGTVLPTHGHADASFCLTLAGDWTDEQDGHRRECGPDEVLFRPRGVVHAQRYPRTARCLNVDVADAWFDAVAGKTFGASFLRFGPRSEATQILRRLRCELARPDDVSALAAEALCLELFVACFRDQERRRGSRAPTWLARAEEYLRAHALEPLRITDVAAAVQVHPTHLARTFRRHFNCTVATYMRRLRVDRARRLLQDTALPLSEVAQEVGFYDQSHFTRCFRAEFGVAPGTFRATVARSFRPKRLDRCKTR
jgi:AraC family transcriptional regulator